MSEHNVDFPEDPYANIAQWYDLEHDPFEDDLQFYRDLAGGSGPTMLEIGCGTGRVTVALARMGREVTAVDASAAMLARCRDRLAHEPAGIVARVHLVQADAAAMGDAAPGPYALAIVPLNTFAHFARPEDRLALLDQVRQRLVPGGRLVVDLDTEGPRRLLGSPGQVWLVAHLHPSPAAKGEAGGITDVLHFASAELDAEPDVAVVTHIYDAQTRDGRVTRTISRMRLGLISTTEARLTLERAGYVVEAVYGSYELDAYAAGAERAILVARS
jgi:SAM-dependent methyltransferase